MYVTIIRKVGYQFESVWEDMRRKGLRKGSWEGMEGEKAVRK